MEGTNRLFIILNSQRSLWYRVAIRLLEDESPSPLADEYLTMLISRSQRYLKKSSTMSTYNSTSLRLETVGTFLAYQQTVALDLLTRDNPTAHREKVVHSSVCYYLKLSTQTTQTPWAHTFDHLLTMPALTVRSDKNKCRYSPYASACKQLIDAFYSTI